MKYRDNRDANVASYDERTIWEYRADQRSGILAPAARLLSVVVAD